MLSFCGVTFVLFNFVSFLSFSVSSLYGECVVRVFLPDGVFLPCDHGLDL